MNRRNKKSNNNTGLLLWLLIIAAGAIFSFAERPRFTLTLDEGELNTLWYVVDKSNAEHMAVKQVQELINRQIQPQLDSLRKKSAAPDSISSPKTKKP